MSAQPQLRSDVTDLPRVDFHRPVICLFGMVFDTISLSQAVARVRKAAALREPLMVTTPNLNYVVAARADTEFRHSALHSQLCVADGMPLVWAARLLGLPLVERVSGSDLFDGLCRSEGGAPIKAYFFGGPQGAAEEACRRVNAQGGGVSCVGGQSPGFVPVELLSDPACIEPIRAAGADLVIVSVGIKKGQAWIDRNRARLGAPVVTYFGAVVNFTAGSVRRAPRWMSRLGFEWMWRILQEPTLWRRYFDDGRAALGLCLRCLLPLWWRRLRGSSGQRPGDVLLDASPHGAVLRLAGNLEGPGQLALRNALEQVALARVPVEVDMHLLDDLDAHACGLLLLLHAWQRDIGRPLNFRGVSKPVQKRLMHHGAEFLLTPVPLA
jgi:N-acetylglucosaminyldiphosphoundecaprenol N-acetyl-beta-D-mannosaminyltransferase